MIKTSMSVLTFCQNKQTYQNRSVNKKRDLWVLAGYLAHASTVVRCGRTFSHRLIDTIKNYPENSSFISIPDWVRFDLAWWSYLLSVFNGTSRVIQTELTPDRVETESSMSVFSAVYGTDWLAGSWGSQKHRARTRWQTLSKCT